MERKLGLYAALRHPRFYSIFRALVLRRAYETFLLQRMDLAAGARVFDIGCGPGDILNLLPAVDYLGVDYSEHYIRDAEARYGDRGRFRCADVAHSPLNDEAGTFDLSIAIGVLHHLDDDLALKLLQLAHEALKPGGHFVSMDGCTCPEQSTLSRRVVKMDRGRFVRPVEHYVELARRVFPRVDATVRHDLLRIPYSHLSLRCGK